MDFVFFAVVTLGMCIFIFSEEISERINKKSKRIKRSYVQLAGWILVSIACFLRDKF